MPYSGVKPGSATEKKIERCVDKLMADPKFKPQKGRTKKSSAIAVCRSSIENDKVEKKKLSSKERKKIPSGKFAYIDSKGGKHLPIHDKAHVRNAMARFNQTHFENSEKKRSAAKKIIAAARRYGIEIDSNSTVARAAKKVAEGKEVKEKVAKKEVKKKKKVKKKKEVIGTEEASSLADLLKLTIEKVDKLLEKQEAAEEAVEEEESAPAEGAAPEAAEAEKPAEEAEEPVEAEKPAEAEPAEEAEKPAEAVEQPVEEAEKPVEAEKPAEEVKEEAPEGGESEAPKEEAEAEEKVEKDASSEGAETTEALNKVSGSLAKLTDKIEKFGDKFAKVEERVEKLEEQPAPSKVVSQYVVSKGGSTGKVSEADAERLKAINKRLEKFEHIRDTNLDRYQGEKLEDKALKLVYEKEDILSRNPSLKL